MTRPLLAIATLALAACGEPAPLAEAPPQPQQQSSCRVDSEGGWSAHVNAMPGPGSFPELIVSGRVVAPTGGYTYDLRPMDNSGPVLDLELVVSPPTGMATQALSPSDVRASLPADEFMGESPARTGVRILCGGEALGAVQTVEIAY